MRTLVIVGCAWRAACCSERVRRAVANDGGVSADLARAAAPACRRPPRTTVELSDRPRCRARPIPDPDDAGEEPGRGGRSRCSRGRASSATLRRPRDLRLARRATDPPGYTSTTATPRSPTTLGQADPGGGQRVHRGAGAAGLRLRLRDRKADVHGPEAHRVRTHEPRDGDRRDRRLRGHVTWVIGLDAEAAVQRCRPRARPRTQLVVDRVSSRLNGSRGSPCRTSCPTRAGRRRRRHRRAGAWPRRPARSRPSARSGTTSRTNAAVAAAFSSTSRPRSTVPMIVQSLGEDRYERAPSPCVPAIVPMHTMRPLARGRCTSAIT